MMSYLYLIIPPVIIILSLSILLILISRKSQSILAEKKKNESGIFKTTKKISILKKSAGKFHQFSLRMSEKIALNFKVFALKLHNLLEKWLRNIKEKKASKKEDAQIGNVKISAEAAEVQKKEGYQSFPKTKVSGELPRFSKTEKNIVSEVSILTDGKKRKWPMIKKTAVYPELERIERKDELENILIERIASDPRDVEAYERLGDYYYGRRNNKDAIDCYKQVLKLSPVNRAVRVKLRRAERGFRQF